MTTLLSNPPVPQALVAVTTGLLLLPLALVLLIFLAAREKFDARG